MAPPGCRRVRVARAMIAAAELSGKETVLDLGCGNGTILFEALALGKAKRVIGIDRNPFLIWLCRLSAWVRGYREDRATFLCADLRTAAIPQADVVMLYLLPPLMRVLRVRLKEALSPHTKIVSNLFPFPGVEGEVRDHETIRLYSVDALS